MDRQLKRLLTLTFVLFGALAAMLTWYQFVRSERLWAHPLNPRRSVPGKSVLRGGFQDRYGEALTTSGVGSDRQYLEESLAHVIGYVDPRYGTTGLERAFDPELSGTTPSLQLEGVFLLLTGHPLSGSSVTLTIDRRVQQVAAAALGDRRGAVVVMDPRTGDVLAMVSRPGFDPHRVGDDWFWLIRDPKLPLLNRATMGLYPPGSAFKPMVGLARLQQSPPGTVDCPGHIVVNGRRISEPGGTAHGPVDLSSATAVSCNVAFVTWGLEAGPDAIRRVARHFGFGEAPPFALPVAASRVPAGRMETVETAETSIGQGKLMVTPLSMALAACGLANGGVVMAPRLVLRVKSPLGLHVRNFPPRLWLRAAAAGETAAMRGAMKAVIQWGTGRQAAIAGIQVAGKTGSAQNPQGRTHAWFIGMAPADAPRVAVAIVIENAGSGGAVAAPIARDVFAEALTRR